VTTPVSFLNDVFNPVSSSFHLIEVERIETYSTTCKSKPASIVKVVLPGQIVLKRQDLVTFLVFPKIDMMAVLANTLLPASIAFSYTIYSSCFVFMFLSFWRRRWNMMALLRAIGETEAPSPKGRGFETSVSQLSAAWIGCLASWQLARM
jgi:hypothetical protein